jgi:hypothetical protein
MFSMSWWMRSLVGLSGLVSHVRIQFVELFSHNKFLPVEVIVLKDVQVACGLSDVCNCL